MSVPRAAETDMALSVSFDFSPFVVLRVDQREQGGRWKPRVRLHKIQPWLTLGDTEALPCPGPQQRGDSATRITVPLPFKLTHYLLKPFSELVPVVRLAHNESPEKEGV